MGNNTKYSEEMLKEAHKHTIFNQEEIMASETCTCFYCGYQFEPKKKELDWIEEQPPRENTAICGMCGIDCVIGDASGLPVTDEDFILQATEDFFGGISRISDRLPVERVKWEEIEVE